MKFLLINTNPIVQKLVEITAKKAGANLVSIKEAGELEGIGTYDYVLIDDDCLLLERQNYLEKLAHTRKCLIYNKQGERIEGFDSYVQKPFLPTSILDIFTSELARAPLGAPRSADEALDLPLGDSLGAHEDISLDNLDEGLQGVDSLLGEDLDEGLASSGNVIAGESESSQGEEADSKAPHAEEAPEALESHNEAAAHENAASELAESTESAPQDEGISAEVPSDDTPSDEAISEMSGLEADISAPQKSDLDEELDIDLDLSGLDALDDFDDGADGSAELDSTKSSALEASDEELEALLSEGDEADIGALESPAPQEQANSDEGLARDDTALAVDSETLGDDELPSELDTPLEDSMSLVESQSSAEAAAESKPASAQDSKDLESDEFGFDDEGLLENDLLDDVEGIDLGDEGKSPEGDAKSVLDKDEIDEVSKALSALESEAEPAPEADKAQELGEVSEQELGSADVADMLDELGEEGETHHTEAELEEAESAEPLLDESLEAAEQAHNEMAAKSAPAGELESAASEQAADSKAEAEDFDTLTEPDVAHALGEELEGIEEDTDSAKSIESLGSLGAQSPLGGTQTITIHEPDEPLNDRESELIKSMVASSVQGSIASLSASNLKSMLDGLEVTINISFKDKSK